MSNLYYRKVVSIMPAPWKEDRIQEVISCYNSGVPLSKVMKIFKADYATIVKYLSKNNIEVRDYRTHNFDQSYFHEINSEDKAYWLGFIFADGCMAKTTKNCSIPNRLSLNISNKDYEHVVKFKRDIKADSTPIKVYEPKGTYSTNLMCRIDVNSIQMCGDLIRHGIFPNKTLKVVFPYHSIKKDFLRHFIRGYFDGNGSIAIGKTACNFSITSNKDFLVQIQKILMNQCNLNLTKILDYPKKQCEVFDLRYGGRLQLSRIFSFLYEDSTIFLDRKYDKFKLAISNQDRTISSSS